MWTDIREIDLYLFLFWLFAESSKEYVKKSRGNTFACRFFYGIWLLAQSYPKYFSKTRATIDLFKILQTKSNRYFLHMVSPKNLLYDISHWSLAQGLISTIYSIDLFLKKAREKH